MRPGCSTPDVDHFYPNDALLGVAPLVGHA
jgi:hypothetical protein